MSSVRYRTRLGDLKNKQSTESTRVLVPDFSGTCSNSSVSHVCMGTPRGQSVCVEYEKFRNSLGSKLAKQ